MIENIVFLPGWSFKSGIWKEYEDYFRNLNFNVIFSELGTLQKLIKNLRLDKTVFIAWSLGWFRLLDILKDEDVLPNAIIGIGAAVKFPRPTVRFAINEFKKNPDGLTEQFYPWLFSVEERNKPIFNRKKDFIHTNRIKDHDLLLKDLLFLQDVDLTLVIKKINIPVLIISGNADVICPKEESGKLSSALSNGRLELMDAGHMPFITRPDRFKQVVVQFIDNLNNKKFK